MIRFFLILPYIFITNLSNASNIDITGSHAQGFTVRASINTGERNLSISTTGLDQNGVLATLGLISEIEAMHGNKASSLNTKVPPAPKISMKPNSTKLPEVSLSQHSLFDELLRRHKDGLRLKKAAPHEKHITPSILTQMMQNIREAISSPRTDETWDEEYSSSPGLPTIQEETDDSSEFIELL